MDGLTYDEVGATRDGPLPTGYRHLSYRTRLGGDVLRVAGEAVLSWRMHEAAGVRVRASAPRAAEGVTLTSELGAGPLRLVAPCRVVWTVDDDGQVGFGYGTLPGHPARGEEAFVVSRAAEGEVWFTVTAFSRPARWFTRVAGPVVPVFQRAYARRLGRALKRLCDGHSPR
jgi:uncharacterized protein (UPF0548 family)